jgi:thymidylate synthase
MKNYIALLQDVYANGIDKESRAGNTRSVFGRTLRWNLAEGFPILTTRRVALRIAFEETMFFLRGETDTKLLEEKRINIWKGNTTREFLDARGLHHLPEGSLGTGYSHQWRNFGGTLGAANSGIDQIEGLLAGLQQDPNGRRHIVSAWNPQQLSGTPLPPCHLYHQYIVSGGSLNSSFILRSNDVPFGLPYNIMGYAFLNMAFAKMLKLEPGELVYFGNDVHIYQNQLAMVEEQMTRIPRQLPKLVINKELNSLDDILALEFTDLELFGYDPLPDIENKPGMAV